MIRRETAESWMAIIPGALELTIPVPMFPHRSNGSNPSGERSASRTKPLSLALLQ
jgi:hypothetical protein